MRTPRVVGFFVFAAIALIASHAFAGEADHYAGKNWALLDTKPVMQAAGEITLASHPDCDSALVDERTVEVYRADGSGDYQDETFTKVLTEKGKNANNVLSLNFMLPYTTIVVPRLEVIKPDGSVVPVNVAANSSESIDSSQMEENIYDPNSRVLQVNIPGLEIGDVVHAVVRVNILRPIIPGEFSDNFLFESSEYIRHISCEIHAPADKPLKHIALRDPVGSTVAYSKSNDADGSAVYRWEVNAVPRMYDEPGMPPYGMVLQRLLVSTLPDWPAVSRWYWQLSQSHLAATSPEMKATVEKLTATAKTDREKVDALFYYVSRNIRYMGITPEKGRPGFEPHDVCLTFSKQYGVCRDKAALLVEMLRLAGLKAYPVLINVGTKLDAEVPSASFNHAIAAVETAPGRYLLMDPTDEHTRTLLPSYDDNQSYLVCRPEGEDLKVSAVSPADDNMLHIATTGQLSADGTLVATSELSFSGVNDDAYRGAFAQMKPDDRRRFFESRLQRALPGSRLTALTITPDNILDATAPLHVKLSFTVPASALFGSRQAVVGIPWIGRDLGVVNFILNGTGLAARKYPLETQVTCGVDEHVSIKLADNFTAALSLPANTTLDDAGASYRRGFDFANRALIGSKEFKLKAVEFSPAQYLRLKQTLKDIATDDRKSAVLAIASTPKTKGTDLPAATAAHPPVSSDAQVLEDSKQLVIKDAHTAVLKVRYVEKILTYAGKISESQVKIPYNPATESVESFHATVTSPTGQQQEASKDEINVMDADWNPSAKRYTGGKIFVDSLPGVEIGSTIEVDYELHLHDNPFIAWFESFQPSDETEQKSFLITAPTDLKLITNVANSNSTLTEKKTSAGGDQTLDWNARHLAALPDEPSQPPAWIWQQGIDFSAGDPADYFKALHQTLLDRASHATQAAALARQLTAHAKTKVDALRAIRDYIAKNIRSAGPSFTELPLDELSAADTTLADGYGHAADQAILLHAMLTAAGFHPEFVLASDMTETTGLKKRFRNFLRPDSFQNLLVSVKTGGKTYYLNDTDQYAQLGTTAHDSAFAVPLKTGGLDIVRATDDCRSREDRSYTLTLADNGDAIIHFKYEFYGANFALENRLFAQKRPKDRARYYQQIVSDIRQGARPLDDLRTDFNTYPGIEEFTVAIDHYGIADGRFLYCNLPAVSQMLTTSANSRATPLFADTLAASTVRTEVNLPPSYRRVDIAPKNARFDFPNHAGTVRMSATDAHHTLGKYTLITYTLTTQLDSSPAIIPPADYPKALATESALENKATHMILLESTATPPAPSQPKP